MGTELLKEQYNQLQYEQKIKLEKLKQKRMTQLKNNAIKNDLKSKNDDMDDALGLDFDTNDDDLGLNSDDLFLSKFDHKDSSSDDDDSIKKKPPIKKPPINNSSSIKVDNKLLIKKNPKKPTDKLKITETGSLDGLDTFRESMSLADKLREIGDENGRLRKAIAEKDYEITFLKKKVEEERMAFTGSSAIGGDVAATKIVDLSKKVRELTAQLESEKSKNKQFAKVNKDLETKLESFKEKKNFKNTDNDYDEVDDDEDDDSNGEKKEKKISLVKENKELKDKLYQTSHKMLEYKSQCEILKQDLKKTQKALEKEVGDNVDIKSIIAGQSNWKGRQQQIRTLQHKLTELKQQVGMMDARASQILFDEEFAEHESNFLKSTAGAESLPRSAAQMSILSGYTSNVGSYRSNLDFRNRSDIRRIEKEKKEQLEKMKREFETMENELNSTKEKFEATKARNKVLANENKTFKEQVKTLLEKGKHDDELVDALMKKQSQLKEVLENMSYENEKVSKEAEDKNREVQIKSMQEKNTIEQMKTVIADKEKRIKQLEQELNSSKENNAPRVQTHEQFFIHSETSKTENNHVSFSNETEFIRARQSSTLSANQVKTSDPNLDREILSSRHSMRSAKGVNQRPSSSNGNSNTGLNAKMIEQKRDKNIDYKLENSELKTLLKTSEIERLRLMDLVKTLQKRIEDLNEKSIDIENKLNEQRRRSVNLEKQNERLKLQDSKNASIKNQAANKQSNNTMDQYKIEELETSLLIQKDENDALKAALKSTLEAKEEDLRLYVEMLESTKRVYLDGLKQYKQISTNES